MHAVLVRVRIKPGLQEEATQYLRAEVVPRVKGAPGLVRGTWFSDGGTGCGVLLFESEAQAQQAAGTASAGPDDPVELQDVHVYEVHAEV